MSDLMRPVPLKELIHRAVAEYRAKGTVFDIPRKHFFVPLTDTIVEIFGGTAGNPIGPAAGPHTQLAQNILCAFLTGARYFELKTVQKLDSLEIEKPCIYARDEGYNVEWSSELTLEKSYDEFLKAWFLLHVFDALIEGPPSPFLFNMSVGYDFDGIRSARMDRFITKLISAKTDALFSRYLEEIREMFSGSSILAGTPWIRRLEHARAVSETISENICKSVTLSTMHGCPPDEIEAICRYMLEEKKLVTLVKLNPTLLGYEKVRETLDSLGYGSIELSKEGFKRDLQFKDAITMLSRLYAFGREKGVAFGIKLTNTLATVNHQSVLSGDEMYLSGRALYPIAVTLCADLAGEVAVEMPVSFSGGISAFNLGQVLACGIRPVTLATDLLKPGGYSRLNELAGIAERSAAHWSRNCLDPQMLRKTANEAIRADYWKKDFRGDSTVAVAGHLPVYDCFIAPCIEACPISQDVPEYIHLAAEGSCAEAFRVLLNRNPLPFITGYLCDHKCTLNCTRIDWEGPVQIRTVKRIVAERGYTHFREQGGWKPAADRDKKIAVIGGGPAGMAASAFLAREGFDVHLFEREASLGGIVGNVIPPFRIPEYLVDRDASLLEDLGVSIHLGQEMTMNVDELKTMGFAYTIIAVGSELDRAAPVEGAIGALEFLRIFRRSTDTRSLGKSVAVIGGGDTAMDAARAAKRCPGVEEVRIVYRRGMAQMPASYEEYQSTKNDGIRFSFLRSPDAWENNKLRCRILSLGSEDESGRPRPIPTGLTEVLDVDTVISAVGQDTDTNAISKMTSGPRSDVFIIGDAARGASTIVKAIASARSAADAICIREGGSAYAPVVPDIESRLDLPARRDRLMPASTEDSSGDTTLSIEGSRCLGCRAVCLKCVEVCPNRANTAIEVKAGLQDVWQIVHIDAFCNSCGNCSTFCPWVGRPFADKVTVFSTIEDFECSTNQGFFLDLDRGKSRFNGHIGQIFVQADDVTITGDVDPIFSEIIRCVVHSHAYLLGPVDG